ncbi:MAG: alanine racemase [Caldisericia bacterium]|nr:alanine racemase [Caldisericia bacterium]MDD4613988.1 alanine racemase [Caldisericia bacterium]
MINFTTIDEHELTALSRQPSNRIIVRMSPLKRNFQTIQRNLHTEAKIIGMVKANAYGHGIVPVSSLLSSLHIDYLGVFTMEEGVHLREHSIQTPILIFGSLLRHHMESLGRFSLVPVIGSMKELQIFLEEESLTWLPFHLKIDSGMGRIGFLCSELPQVLHYIQSKNAQDRIQGICTHYADASNPASNYTQWQTESFEHSLGELPSRIRQKSVIHTCNSAAFLRFPQYHYNAIRPGLIMYGICPFSKDQPNWHPVLSLTSYISVVRTLPKGSYISYNRTFQTTCPTTIAIIPIGYADGIPLSLSNRGWVLYRQTKCPIIGNVCMNQFTIDVSACKEVHLGDEVTLIGKEGCLEITAADVARWSNTIPYEILCNLSTALPRFIVKDTD